MNKSLTLEVKKKNHFFNRTTIDLILYLLTQNYTRVSVKNATLGHLLHTACDKSSYINSNTYFLLFSFFLLFRTMTFDHFVVQSWVLCF